MLGRGWPIRTLFLGVTLVTLLPLLAGELVHSVLLARHDRKLAETLTQDASHAIAANVGRFVEDSRVQVATLARKPGLVGRGREPVHEILGEMLEFEPRFAGAAVLDRDGRTLATLSRRGAAPAGLTVSPALVEGMLASPTTYMSEPFHGRISGTMVCVIGARLPSPAGSQAALVGASVDLKALDPMLRVPLRASEAKVLIVSGQGRVVATAPEMEAAFPGQDVSRTALGRLLTGKREGHGVTEGLDGVRTVFGFTAIPSSDWIVAVGVPDRNVMAVVRSRFWDRLTLILVGLVAGLLVATYASHLIAQSIGRLEEAAGASALGKTPVLMPISGPREIRSVAASLQQMTETLRRNERASALGSVVAGLAHQIRGPLFGLEALVDALAARANEPDAAARYAPHLLVETRRLSRISTTLLDYGREHKLEPEIVPLDWVLGAAVEAVRPEAAARGVELVLATSADPVRLDRQLGIDLFVNLIENAVGFSGTGDRVDVLGTARAGGVEVEVLDRGPGIKPEDLPHVFEPFFSRRPQGTGVGLALVRRLVEDHGGTILAENREGGGARFRVHLPSAP